MKPRTDMIVLRERTEGSRFAWLYGELRSAILDGRLAPGSRVPSTRRLSQAYGVARGTVVAVFEQLLAEGYVASTVGSGTVVAEALPDDWFRASAPRVPREERSVATGPISARGRRLVRHRWLVASTTPPLPFRPHHPEVDVQTLKLWRRLSGRAVSADIGLATTGDPFGHLPLRELLAEHLRRVRGLRCNAEQIMILASTHQALDLAARLLTDPGDTALIEDPGYPGARAVFESSDLVLGSLPVDAEGAHVAAVDPVAANARIAYVTPAHQFPLGVTMSARRRLELLAWASQADAWIFEDDYDGEYRFTTHPVAALAGLDEHERVLHVGTLSKILFPSLRLAYMVIPASHVDAFGIARGAFDRFPAIAGQLVLAEFMAEGHFERHLRRMRALYAERQACFVTAIERECGDALRVEPSTTGLQAVGWLGVPESDREIARRALAYGVEGVAMSVYRIARPVANGLHLGFGGYDCAQIEAGATRLGRALRRE